MIGMMMMMMSVSAIQWTGWTGFAKAGSVLREGGQVGRPRKSVDWVWPHHSYVQQKSLGQIKMKSDYGIFFKILKPIPLLPDRPIHKVDVCWLLCQKSRSTRQVQTWHKSSLYILLVGKPEIEFTTIMFNIWHKMCVGKVLLSLQKVKVMRNSHNVWVSKLGYLYAVFSSLSNSSFKTI